MKLFFLLPALLLCGVAHADVASVRREVGRIDAMKLSAKTYSRPDLSSEGAQISVWRDAKGMVRKIVGHIYGETGREHDTIYLQNGLPLFLLTIKERYKGILSPSVKVAKRDEMRLYFENGHLFQRRDGGKVTPLSAAHRREGDQSVREMVRVYMADGK